MRLASAGIGALLTVDDLHEADEASLRLLHYLARSGTGERLVLLLCHRRQPLTEVFDHMRSSLLSRGAAVDVSLLPLTEDQTAALVASLRPGLATAVVAEIWDYSGGVPFAVVEAARLASQDVARTGGPGTVVLNLLDPGVRVVMERVAVTGSTFDTDEFVALAGLAEDEAFDCLDAALAAMVVERTPTGFRFRHQLVRDALLDGVPEHRQRQLHRACA
jgi:predicted ATPase